MTDLVTLGETMGLVAATGTGPFTVGAAARVSFGGAESNVAIGLARLGHRPSWVGRLGGDPIGAMIVDRLRGEGIDVDAVRIEPEVPTGLMLREHRTADRVRVGYYRRGFAGSRLHPDDLAAVAIAEARRMHVTGITPALSATARDAVDRAVALAGDAGVPVSFDVNHRSTLWPTPWGGTDPGAVYTPLAEAADLIFAGWEEVHWLLGESVDADDPGTVREATKVEDAAGRLADRFGADVVIKLGADGASAVVDRTPIAVPGLPVTGLDPVGAGDAFVAGYLSAVLDGEPPATRLARGCACGAFAVSVAGDWEGLPRRSELALLAGSEDVAR